MNIPPFRSGKKSRFYSKLHRNKEENQEIFSKLIPERVKNSIFRTSTHAARTNESLLPLPKSKKKYIAGGSGNLIPQKSTSGGRNCCERSFRRSVEEAAPLIAGNHLRVQPEMGENHRLPASWRVQTRSRY
jgi:hypothetical protein